MVIHRSAQELQAQGQLSAFTGTLWRFPLVYLIIFIVRFLLICLFRPLFRLSRQDLPFKEIAFATVAGLRGSVSLILTQAVVVDPASRNAGPEVTVRQRCLSLQCTSTWITNGITRETGMTLAVGAYVAAQPCCLCKGGLEHACTVTGSPVDKVVIIVQKIKAEIVLWTAGFVLMTLVINAPLLPFFLRVSGLAKGER